MKAFKIFSMFALSAMMAACTSDEIEQIQKSQNTDGIPFTATIRIDEGATTRALTDNGTQIDAAWAVGEKVALVHNGVNDEMEVESVSGGVATISGTITGDPTDGDAVTVIYPSSAADGTTGNVKDDVLIGQDGTLTGTGGTSISDKYDVRKSSGAQLEVVSGTASLKGNVSLTSQIAIWKLTLQCGGAALSAKSLSVKDASDNLLASATLASAGSVFYVAIPAMTSVKITAVSGAKTYAYSKASVSINTGKYYQSTVNLTQEEYTDLSATATANTYMVAAAGKYKFNAKVKGNGGLDPITGVTATPITGIAGVKVLWELYGQGRAIKYEGSVYDISYSDGYVYFSTPDTFVPGDCYVAVYDDSNNILWSWLIWATPEMGTTTNNGKTFMDRNLGAINVGYCMRGFLYQWSRKDPFSAANGNNYSYYTFVPAAATTFGTQVSSAQSMAYTVLNPTIRISEYPWMLDDERVKSPWRDDVKTIYDPCPEGWRVPTKTDMANFQGLPATGMYDPTTGSSYNYFGNPGLGYYQTSTIGTDKTKNWAYCNDNRLEEWGQTSGRAIRPVKDVPPATSKSLTSLTTAEIGWRIGSDGNAYSPGILPSGVTAVAMVAYVGSETDEVAPKNHGLAIALSDEASKMNWNQAMSETGAAAHTPSITGYSWKLPSRENWENMFNANGGNAESHTGLDAALTSVGGYVLLQGQEYWSSTRVTGTYDRVTIYINSTGAATASQRTDISGVPYVRACFAF
jgi:hypothetical protein